MLGSDVLRFAAEGVLGVWILVGEPRLWGFVILAALMGTGQAFFSPAMTGLVSQILDEENLQQGNALNGLSESAGGVAGPALAGVIVATSSPGWAVLVDALSYLVSVASLAMVRVDWEVTKPGETFFILLREGWRQFWARTWLWAVVIQSSIVNVVIFAPYYVLGPEIAKKHLGGAAAWGLVLASLGAGAIAGGIVMLRVSPRRPLLFALTTTFVWAIPLVTMAITTSTVTIAIGSFLGGAAMSIFGALWNTTMQREIPPEVLSRVSAYDWFGSLAFLPLGMAIVGPVATALGSNTVLVTAAVLTVLLTGVVLLVPAITGLQAPPASVEAPIPDMGPD